MSTGWRGDPTVEPVQICKCLVCGDGPEAARLEDTDAVQEDQKNAIIEALGGRYHEESAGDVGGKFALFRDNEHTKQCGFDGALGVEFWNSSTDSSASPAKHKAITLVIVVYDMNDNAALEHVVSVWRPRIVELGSAVQHVILVGTHYDRWQKNGEIFGQAKPTGRATSLDDGNHVLCCAAWVAELIGANYFICCDVETQYGLSVATPDDQCQADGSSITVQSAIIKLNVASKDGVDPEGKGKGDGCTCLIA